MLHLYDNIKYLRSLTGLSQAAFGQLFGASKDMIFSYEKGTADPSDKTMGEMAELFGLTTDEFKNKKQENKIRSVQWQQDFTKRIEKRQKSLNSSGDDPFRDKYIASLERENARLQKDLDLSLGEIRHNILIGRAIAETNQQLLIELLAKQRKTSLEEVALEAGKANGEKYKKMKEEGSFAYVGK